VDPKQRRTWPYPPSNLELLAGDAGLDPDVLRESLRRQIADRLRADSDEHESSDEHEKAERSHQTSRTRVGREERAWAAALHPDVVAVIDEAMATLR
jgi:hypothetical protein